MAPRVVRRLQPPVDLNSTIRKGGKLVVDCLPERTYDRIVICRGCQEWIRVSGEVITQGSDLGDCVPQSSGRNALLALLGHVLSVEMLTTGLKSRRLPARFQGGGGTFPGAHVILVRQTACRQA